MPDVDTALEELQTYPRRAPHGPSEPGTIVERARRRRTRRRVGLTGAALALAAIAVAVPVIVASDDDDGPEVVVGNESTTPTPTADALVVEPASGLEDAQQVRVSGPIDGAGALAQCASEALTVDDPIPWCDINVSWHHEGTYLLATVLRVIETSNGLVDCAERPARCVLGVRVGSTDATAPISFRTDLGPVPTPLIEVSETSLRDGQDVVVRGSGFRPGDEMTVSQCVGTPGELERDEQQPCDQARFRRLVADDDGTFAITMRLFTDVLTYDGWTRCEPCTLQTGGFRQGPARVLVEVETNGAPIRPTVAIEPAGPYTARQVVTLTGEGFQRDVDVDAIGWCAFHSDDPATEMQGDAADGNAGCAYPDAGFSGHTDAGGRFTIGAFPMPDAFCGSPESQCGLAIHPWVASFPTFVTLFELVE